MIKILLYLHNKVFIFDKNSALYSTDQINVSDGGVTRTVLVILSVKILSMSA